MIVSTYLLVSLVFVYFFLALMHFLEMLIDAGFFVSSLSRFRLDTCLFQLSLLVMFLTLKVPSTCRNSKYFDLGGNL